uniref:Apolipoprotein M n=1 Tax=Echeneis naucrates TaxID=173247 RepID=A0A665U299_ECHNA
MMQGLGVGADSITFPALLSGSTFLAELRRCFRFVLSRMCCMIKQAVLLLLLAAAVSSQTVPAPQDCENAKKMLPSKDLHTLLGDWVLVWAISDKLQDWDLLVNISSTHIQFQLHDNKTLTLIERNNYIDGCATLMVNFTMPSEPSDEHIPLHSTAITEEKDGVVRPYNDPWVMDVYESCSDCLTVVYKESEAQFLMNYRREGHHSDVEQLTATHAHYRKQAECLGFTHEKTFIYDGVSGE